MIYTNYTYEYVQFSLLFLSDLDLYMCTFMMYMHVI